MLVLPGTYEDCISFPDLSSYSLCYPRALSAVLLIGPEADRALCSQHRLGIVSAAAAGLLVVGVVCCAVVAAGAVAVVVVSRGPPLDLRKPDIVPGWLSC